MTQRKLVTCINVSVDYFAAGKIPPKLLHRTALDSVKV